jgi:hypothetical protein
MEDWINRAVMAKAARDERRVKSLLTRWVSELEPAIAYDLRGNIIGLTLADAPVGSCPWVMK